MRERQCPEKKDGGEVARGARFLPLMEERDADASVTEKRTEKEKTAPKALLYLSYNYHNRAPRRAPPVPTNPSRAPRSTRPQPQIGNSRIHFPFVARSLARSLEIVRRRTSAVESEGC